MGEPTEREWLEGLDPATERERRDAMTADVNVTEKVARALARVGPGEDWPTNEELGGNPTGTRDDEYRRAMHEDALAALAALHSPDVLAGIAGALLAALHPHHDPDECSDDWQRDQADRLAVAVVDWLTGGRQ